MASVETKKVSTPVNKVVTPKTLGGSAPASAQGPSDLEHALVKAIGARVRIVTSGPSSQTIEGNIFTTDRVTNIVAVSASPPTPSQPSDFHLIHISRIQSFIIVSLPPTGQNSSSFADAVPSIGPIDYEELEKREAQAVAVEKEREQRRKHGVTAEAEELFNAIGRMLPIRWSGNQMIVNEIVLINPPFRPEDCQAPKSNEAGLARVRKVMENERRKYAERTSKTTTGNGPAARKGG